MFAHKVHDAPSPVALLDVPDGERRDLRSSKAAAKENGQNGLISRGPYSVKSGAFSSACAWFAVSQFPKRTPFDATPFTRDPSKFRRQEPVVRGFDCQLAYRRDPDVDRDRAQLPGLEAATRQAATVVSRSPRAAPARTKRRIHRGRDCTLGA